MIGVSFTAVLAADDTGLDTNLILTVTPYPDTLHVKVEDASLHEDDNPMAHVTLKVTRHGEGEKPVLEAIVQDSAQLSAGEGDDHRIVLYDPVSYAEGSP